MKFSFKRNIWKCLRNGIRIVEGFENRIQISQEPKSLKILQICQNTP